MGLKVYFLINKKEAKYYRVSIIQRGEAKYFKTENPEERNLIPRFRKCSGYAYEELFILAYPDSEEYKDWIVTSNMELADYCLKSISIARHFRSMLANNKYIGYDSDDNRKYLFYQSNNSICVILSEKRFTKHYYGGKANIYIADRGDCKITFNEVETGLPYQSIISKLPHLSNFIFTSLDGFYPVSEKDGLKVINNAKKYWEDEMSQHMESFCSHMNIDYPKKAELPYTKFCVARNKDGSLCMFDTIPTFSNGTWFVYHNGERDYGYRLDYTNPLCKFVTFDNSPYPLNVTIDLPKGY